jgi:hypothetical protein
VEFIQAGKCACSAMGRGAARSGRVPIEAE